MGYWHLVLILGWIILIWYSACALVRPKEESTSEFLPYSGELLVLVAIFFIIFSLQQIFTNFFSLRAFFGT